MYCRRILQSSKTTARRRYTIMEIVALCDRLVHEIFQHLATKLADQHLANDAQANGKVAVIVEKHTNDLFDLEGSERISAWEISRLRNLEDHATLVCARLDREGRLVKM